MRMIRFSFAFALVLAGLIAPPATRVEVAVAPTVWNRAIV